MSLLDDRGYWSSIEQCVIAEEIESLRSKVAELGCVRDSCTLIPTSELKAMQAQRDVLLKALERAANHIQEITSFGGKYHGLSGAVVSDSYAEAAAAFQVIESVKGDRL